jgi:hypothetical protein
MLAYLKHPATIKKALTALVTGLGVAISHGLVPEPYDTWGVVVFAVLGVFGVYGIKNAHLPPAVRPADDEGVRKLD